MSYPGVTCRLIEIVGEFHEVVAMWDGDCTTVRGGPSSLHVSRARISLEQRQGDWWPTHGGGTCDRCGIPIPWASGTVKCSKGTRNRYSTASGQPEPGDLFWQLWNVKGKRLAKRDGVLQLVDDPTKEHYCDWSNCTGPHLMAVCPNGAQWDIDSRASNCDQPDNTTHRCWIREGTPGQPDFWVSKGGNAGDTCTAGAGSIQAGDYHGFVQAGAFTGG